MIKQRHSERRKKEKEKLNEQISKLPAMTKQREDFRTKWEFAQSEIQRVKTEKFKLDQILSEFQNNAILKNKKRVDKLLNFKVIRREFYEEIFTEKKNLHFNVFEYVRKEIKNKTGFKATYCKQMAFKLLFEIILLCYNQTNFIFNNIYNAICR